MLRSALKADRGTELPVSASRFLHFMPEDVVLREIDGDERTLDIISWRGLAQQSPELALELLKAFLGDAPDVLTLKHRWDLVSAGL